MDKRFELMHQTPFWDEVIEMYDESKEHIQEANYRIELLLRKLKRSVSFPFKLTVCK